MTKELRYVLFKMASDLLGAFRFSYEHTHVSNSFNFLLPVSFTFLFLLSFLSFHFKFTATFRYGRTSLGTFMLGFRKAF